MVFWHDELEYFSHSNSLVCYSTEAHSQSKGGRKVSFSQLWLEGRKVVFIHIYCWGLDICYDYQNEMRYQKQCFKKSHKRLYKKIIWREIRTYTINHTTYHLSIIREWWICIQRGGRHSDLLHSDHLMACASPEEKKNWLSE